MKFIAAGVFWAMAALVCVGNEAPMEKRVIFGGDSAQSWYAAEATMGFSTARVKASQASLHWHVTVDYQTGEPEYPIGWPRVNHAIAAGERDWSEWEFLQMWVYADTSREALPREPVGLGLHAPDRASAFHRPLSELKKGEWVQICIPVAQIAGCGDVRQIQFHISESNYRHGDTLDIYIDELALVRHAAPALADFAAESAVVFSDARYLPVRFQVLGVKAGAAAEVRCELRHNRGVTAQGAWRVPRGPQRRVFELGRERLAAGDYELLARIADSPPLPAARLRVVESPWEESGKETGK